MTNQEYQNWLADLSVERVILCELYYAGGVEYVSTHSFISKPADSVPNRIYDDLLQKAVDITVRADALLDFGELTLIDDGSITSWRNRAWRGHDINIYLGGPDWSLDDFRIFARGMNDGISSAKRGRLSFGMLDQSAKLDEVIETGSLPDDAGPVPLALGSIYNAPAYRIETQTLRYKASYLPVTSLKGKDNGQSVSHTTTASAGTLTLSNGLVGQLSVDIEEQHNTPALITQWVAQRYGIEIGSIEMPAYRVGLYYNADVTGKQILDELCEGLGAYWYLDELGALHIRQNELATSADVVLFEDDIAWDKIELSSTEPPYKSLSLNWGRNYQTLNTVAGAVDDGTPEEAARLKREWSTSTATQDTSDYPLAETVTINTPIANVSDAAAERDRVLALRSRRIDQYAVSAFLPSVELGQTVQILSPVIEGRFGRIIGISRSPTKGVTNLTVWLPQEVNNDG